MDWPRSRATPSRAAATGGVTLFVLALAGRALNFSLLKQVLRDTMVITGSLFALLVGATVFTLIVRAFGTCLWVTSLMAGPTAGGVYATLLAGVRLPRLCPSCPLSV